jgi:uncharacterized membrane protein (UPF0127 family)
VFVAAALLAACVPRAAAAGHGPSVDVACANPALPAEILKAAPPRTADPLDVVEVIGAGKPLRLAVAKDAASRELGLMCVTGLHPQRGMLFVFTEDGPQPFWMKNTLISLDMIWVDTSGTVTSVADHVPASTRSTSDRDVARRTGSGRFVIELAAGEAQADGLAAGTRLMIPVLRATP